MGAAAKRRDCHLGEHVINRSSQRAGSASPMVGTTGRSVIRQCGRLHVTAPRRSARSAAAARLTPKSVLRASCPSRPRIGVETMAIRDPHVSGLDKVTSVA